MAAFLELTFIVYYMIHPLLFMVFAIHAIFLAIHYSFTFAEWVAVLLFSIVITIAVFIASLVGFGQSVSLQTAELFISAGPLPIGTLLFTIATTCMKLTNRCFKWARVTFQLSMGVTIFIGSTLAEILPKLLGVTITY